jgi:hypothetical protein
MDLDFIRMAVMLGSFGLFLALMAWTWSPRRRDVMDLASRAPFDGDVVPAPAEGNRHE